jgi:hypothetical protein
MRYILDICHIIYPIQHVSDCYIAHIFVGHLITWPLFLTSHVTAVGHAMQVNMRAMAYSLCVTYPRHCHRADISFLNVQKTTKHHVKIWCCLNLTPSYK